MRFRLFIAYTSIALLCTPAEAQESSSVVGAWRYAAVFLQGMNGPREELWDGKQNGMLIFSSDGFFAIQLSRSDLPKIASGSPASATSDESEAIARGTYASFGTYKVDHAKHMIVVQIQGSSFPNEIGTRQERIFEVSGDTLTYVNTAPRVGGLTAINVLKREK